MSRFANCLRGMQVAAATVSTGCICGGGETSYRLIRAVGYATLLILVRSHTDLVIYGANWQFVSEVLPRACPWLPKRRKLAASLQFSPRAAAPQTGPAAAQTLSASRWYPGPWAGAVLRLAGSRTSSSSNQLLRPPSLKYLPSRVLLRTLCFSV